MTGDLFRGMTANRQVRTVSSLVSVLGRAVTIVVGGAVPGSFGRLLARYWAFVLLLSAVLLLGVGFAIGGQGLKTAGWIGIGVALLVLLVVSAFPWVRRAPHAPQARPDLRTLSAETECFPRNRQGPSQTAPSCCGRPGSSGAHEPRIPQKETHESRQEDGARRRAASRRR